MTVLPPFQLRIMLLAPQYPSLLVSRYHPRLFSDFQKRYLLSLQPLEPQSVYLLLYFSLDKPSSLLLSTLLNLLKSCSVLSSTYSQDTTHNSSCHIAMEDPLPSGIIGWF